MSCCEPQFEYQNSSKEEGLKWTNCYALTQLVLTANTILCTFQIEGKKRQLQETSNTWYCHPIQYRSCEPHSREKNEAQKLLNNSVRTAKATPACSKKSVSIRMCQMACVIYMILSVAQARLWVMASSKWNALESHKTQTMGKIMDNTQ